ncbi:MAG: hypothetical protein U0Q15_02060 [Kineosporiaceae bacterium]
MFARTMVGDVVVAARGRQGRPMRLSRRSLRLAAPAAVLTLTAGMGVAVAAVAVPSAPDGVSQAASTTGSKPKTTKPPKTKSPKPTSTTGCPPGCTLVVNDFETDSQGWALSDGSPLGVTTASAASGKQALAPARITEGYGPSTTIPATTLARAVGQRVVVTLSVKATAPVRRKPVTLLIKGADAAVSASVPPTGKWQTLRAAFVPTGEAVSITVVEGVGDPCRGYPKILQVVSVDDVTVGVPVKPVKIKPAPTSTKCSRTPTPTPTDPTPTPSPTGSWCPTCTVLTTDFEDATPQGWVSYRGSVVAATKEAAASGSYGLLAKAVRYAAGASLTIDTAVLDKRPSLAYELTAQVKLAPGQLSSKLQLDVTGAETITQFPAVATSDGWATVRTRFVPGAALTDVMTFTLHQFPISLGPDIPTDVYLDDVQLKPAPATTPTPTTTGPKPDLTCTAIDMPAVDAPGATVTIRNLGPASLADWTVRMTTGQTPVKVSPGVWSFADGVVTVQSPPNQGALKAGETLVLHLEGRNGNVIFPYPVSLNGVNCAVAMP